MTFPLPSLAATVDANGITAPSLADILSSLTASYQSIYGDDTYLGPDSQDGQWLAIQAKAIFDCNSVAIAVYNQFSPATAQGVGLSSVVKINGIARLVPTFDTVNLTVIGQAGAIISNGIVGDDVGLNTQWALPSTVVIPFSGTVTASATCTQPGAVHASAGTLTVILTPTPGWQSVTNPADAVLGAPVESDATLRRRQSQSTAIPAQSPLDGIYGRLANLPGVQRLTIHENDTNATDGDGVPSHSIAAVVEGGDPVAIATVIAESKCPGTGTYGTITEVVVDPVGIPNTIHFYPLTLTTLGVLVFLTPLPGYVGSTAGFIQQALSNFVSNLDISEDSYLSRLWAPAGLSGDAATAATGQTQAQLDALSRTYNVTAMAQANEHMVVTGGPYGAGSSSISVVEPNYVAGSFIYFQLDNGARQVARVLSVTGDVLDLTPYAVPAGRSVTNGTPVFVAGDVAVGFNEAVESTVDDITMVVS